MNKSAVIIAATGIILTAGMAVDRGFMPRPEDATAYHARVREKAAKVPLRIGDWEGKDVPPQKVALEMLKPNGYIDRTYTNLSTGVRAQLVLIHCTDAWDMLYHYPPNCYGGGGAMLRTRQERDWDLGEGLRLIGVEYKFARGQSSTQIVANCMLTPRGPARDMDAVWDLTQDARRRFWGVGQIQVILDASVPREQRDEIFQTLAGACRPVIEQIFHGEAR